MPAGWWRTDMARFFSTRFFDEEIKQWITGIHDEVTDQIAFLADDFQIKPGLSAKDATPDDLAEWAAAHAGAH
jgi:hypothetical protein